MNPEVYVMLYEKSTIILTGSTFWVKIWSIPRKGLIGGEPREYEHDDTCAIAVRNILARGGVKLYGT
jgi:hypothetical protein